MPKRDKASAEHFREWIHSARGIIKIKLDGQPTAEWCAQQRELEQRKAQSSEPAAASPRRKRA